MDRKLSGWAKRFLAFRSMINEKSQESDESSDSSYLAYLSSAGLGLPTVQTPKWTTPAPDDSVLHSISNDFWNVL